MKNTLLFLICFVSLNLFGQDINPESFKSFTDSRFKGDINIYYNPQLDDYNIHFVKLDLEVSDQSTYISGNATIQAKVVESLDTLIFDFCNYMTMDSIFINDVKVTASHENDMIQFIFDTPLSSSEEIKAQIYYHGTPYQYGGGVSNDYDSEYGKNMTWTLSESFHAKEWWPCKQVLSDKIDSVYIFLTCDDDCMAGSNGLLTDVVNLPENKKRFEWKTNYPINYYLISFAVSEYQDYSIYAKPEGVDSVLIQNFVYNTSNYLSENKEGIDKTIDFVELFSEKFGLYPFANEKYGHCLTTLGGGLEHQTMTTIGNLSTSWYNIIAHELGHMWFGDYVTCATWQDIWINEGFASYTEYIALENLKSYDNAQDWMYSAHNYALQERSGSVYIPFSEASSEGRIFSYRLSYKKGAALLHMIRHELNDDDLFFAILQNYLTEFGDSVATGDDFKNSLELHSGIDFDPFFNQWYYGKGFPRFNVDYKQLNDTLLMTVTQTSSSSETPLFQIHVDYQLMYNGGDTTIRLFQSENVEIFKIPFTQTINDINVDPENWILNETGTVNSINHLISDKNLYKILPNPVKEKLNVDFSPALNKDIKQIKIYDLNGRLIYTADFIENNFIIDVSNFSEGMYLIQGNTGNKACSFKFIKH